MTEEKIEKIANLFKNNIFGIFTEKNPTEESFLASEALRLALTIAKKQVVPDINFHNEFHNKWKDIVVPQNDGERKLDCPQKIHIKIAGASNISEVNYDKNDEFLSFFITPKNGNLSPEHVQVTHALPQIETVFCLFEKESLLAKIEEKYNLPKKESIVMIAPNDLLVAEKVSDVIKILDNNIYADEKVATLIFASLIIETGNFSHHLSKEILDMASELLKNGANKEVVKSIQEAEKTPDITKILGRALARTYVDDQLNTVWTFIPQKDFTKTNTTPSNSLFLYLIKSFISLMPEKLRYLILWEDREKIHGFVFAKKEEYLTPLASRLGTQLQSTFFATPPYDNFSEAEAHLRQLLKAVS